MQATASTGGHLNVKVVEASLMRDTDAFGYENLI